MNSVVEQTVFLGQVSGIQSVHWFQDICSTLICKPFLSPQETAPLTMNFLVLSLPQLPCPKKAHHITSSLCTVQNSLCHLPKHKFQPSFSIVFPSPICTDPSFGVTLHAYHQKPKWLPAHARFGKDPRTQGSKQCVLVGFRHFEDKVNLSCWHPSQHYKWKLGILGENIWMIDSKIQGLIFGNVLVTVYFVWKCFW